MAAIAVRWSVAWSAATASLGCAAARPRPPLPIRLVTSGATDSVLHLLRASLLAESLPVDGDPIPAGLRTITSTFRVREGGLGASTIMLRIHVAADTSAVAGVVVTLDASAEERSRPLSIGTDDPRDPRQIRGPHEVNPNDRETLQRIRRLVDRLRSVGFAVQP